MVSRSRIDLSQTPNPWRLVDRLLAGYGVIVAVVCLTRLELSGIPLVLAAHLSLPLLAWLVTRASTTGTGAVLRAAYPIVILTGLYTSIGLLNGSGQVATFDNELRALERWLFGFEPARDWWRASPSAFWSTIFHADYFSYYLAVPLPIVVLLIQKRPAAIEMYLDGVVAVFLVCYLCYLVAPVAGPYYQFAHPTGMFVDNGPARLVYATLSGGSAFGAAFPSSHVAAMTAASIGAWRADRRVGIVVIMLTALLAVGVVYCQMHYVIDSVAGLLVGVAVPVVVMRYNARRIRTAVGGAIR
jgi:membrane-associated phospholipid phosphatase